MRYLIFFASVMILMSFGAYIWKVRQSGLLAAEFLPTNRFTNESRENSGSVIASSSALIEIAGDKIQKEDIDWEYELLIDGVFDQQSMTAIPDLGDQYRTELQTLRKNLLSSLVERKVLFAFIRSDRDFDAMDPGRFTDCLTTWQNLIADGHRLLQNRENRSRLKARLCEKAVIDQYLREKVFSKIAVSESEVGEYYRNHLNEFKRPERVSIQQIVLPNEQLAQKLSYQLNASNFEELARSNSIAPEASQGGKLGPFAKGTMPSFFDVAFHMKKGQLSPVLKSPYGFHIIMLNEKMPAYQVSLGEAYGTIHKLLVNKRKSEEYEELVEQALAAIHVSAPAVDM